MELWTGRYRDKEDSETWDDTLSTAPGYQNYNVRKDGYFCRNVAPDKTDPGSKDRSQRVACHQRPRTAQLGRFR
ncbi:hypothetical protein ABT373_04340 [Streptomyces sp. NPDC000070]|uniref:hypothetical protein n=1 Tax=Streptomyces sp. NPDC000070 TaxID=3154240 RepID=UPI00331A7C55